jgi:phage/plasmid-associated DNA primase
MSSSKNQLNTFKSATDYYTANEMTYFTCPEITTYLNKDGCEKKNCPPFPNHKNFTKKDYAKHHEQQSTLCLITGATNNITVIDFDDIIAYKKLVSKHDDLINHYTVSTNKGVHIYFKYDERFKTSVKCFKDYEGVDIRNDGALVFAPPTHYELLDGSCVQYKHNGKKIAEIPDFMYNLLKDERKDERKEKPKEKPKEKLTEKITKKLTENKVIHSTNIIDLIDVQYIDDFDTWLRIVWAMKKEGFPEETIKSMSKRSTNYSDEGFKNVYEKSPSNINISHGTLNYYAKLSNKTEYYEIIKTKYDFDGICDDDFSKIIINEMGDDFLYQNDILYTYYNEKWHGNNELAHKVVKNFLIDFAFEIIESENKLLKRQMIAGEDTHIVLSKLDFLKKALRQIKTVKTLKNIVESLKINLVSSRDEVIFDSYLPDVLCFKNINIDLLKGSKCDVLKSDYVTHNTGYLYEKPTDEQKQTITQLVADVFPIEEEKLAYLSVLFQGMTGHRTEKFILANGSGRNGKGFINELFRSMLGDEYSYKGNVASLTKQIKEGANPEIANMSQKRFTILTEPNDNEDIQGSNIKTLTGDDVLNARGLYSSNTKTRLYHTMVLECNKKPNIAGKLDNSIANRLIDIPFRTFFTDDERELETLDNCKPCNLKIKEESFKREHRCAFFEYLLQHAPKKLYVPDSIKARTAEYIEDCDPFLSWFNDNYDHTTDKNDVVKVKDIFHDFKNKDYYQNLNKKEKRELNEKKFIKMIQENLTLHKYYFDRKKIGDISHRNIIVFYKPKPEPNFIEI